MVKRVALFLAFVPFLLSVCGCAALVVGAAGGLGTAVWLGGKLSEDVNASYDRTIKATKSALGSLDMDINKETKKDEVAQIMSEYTDGTTTWIDIRPITDTKTKVEIRVGATGNKDASRKILDRIKKYL